MTMITTQIKCDECGRIKTEVDKRGWVSGHSIKSGDIVIVKKVWVMDTNLYELDFCGASCVSTWIFKKFKK